MADFVTMFADYLFGMRIVCLFVGMIDGKDPVTVIDHHERLLVRVYQGLQINR
jgi:hypothetical protein